jgi:regulator of protease activity HflC (stomatin/prohibitin superfamily)
MDRLKNPAVACILITGVLLTVILVPLSLAHVEYYQYGLLQRKTTGNVNTEEVYGRGRYLLGVTIDFLTYQADGDFVSRAKDGIKNEAIFVTFDEYFRERKAVERRFKEAVQKRWNTPPSVHCTLDQFHLGRIQIPDSVAERQLECRVQNERNDKESFLQQAQLERELTDVEVNKILLEQQKVLRTARAEASLIRANAQVEAAQIRASAQIEGTSLLFLVAGIDTQEERTAFTYIRALQNRPNLDLDINYLSADNVLRTSAA